VRIVGDVRGKYVTVKGLEAIWEMLDEACGKIDNALMLLGENKNLPEGLKTRLDLFDLSEVVNLKNEVEELIDERLAKAREKING
jgi:hypothetical protein